MQGASNLTQKQQYESPRLQTVLHPVLVSAHITYRQKAVVCHCSADAQHAAHAPGAESSSHDSLNRKVLSSVASGGADQQASTLRVLVADVGFSVADMLLDQMAVMVLVTA